MVSEASGAREGEQVLPGTVQVHNTLPTAVGLKEAQYEWINPVQGLQQTGLVHFKWASSGNKWLDVHNTFVYIVYRIVGPDGNPIVTRGAPVDGGPGPYRAQASVLPINGLAATMFSQVKVEINRQVVDSGGNNMYAHQSDLEMRLGYAKDAKEGHLSLSGFSEETAAFDDIPVVELPFEQAEGGDPLPDAQLLPMMRRFRRTAGSKRNVVIGRIHSPIFEQPKYFPPGIEVRVSFDRKPDKFLLLTKRDDLYRLVIDEFKLLTRTVDSEDALKDDVQRVSFAGNSLVYPLRRVKMETYTVTAGNYHLGNPHILENEAEMPRRIFVGVLNHEAFFGHYKKDPFNYQHLNISKVGLRIGGSERPWPSFDGIDFGPNSNMYALPLLGLLQATNKLLGDEELGIDMDNYRHRNCIFGFDLTSLSLPPGMCYEEGESLKKIELVLNMSRATTESVEVVIDAEYDAELHLRNGKVVMNDDA